MEKRGRRGGRRSKTMKARKEEDRTPNEFFLSDKRISLLSLSLPPCCCYHSCQETKGEELFFLPLLSFLKGGTEKGGSGKKKTLKIARRPSFSSSSAAASLPSSLFFLFRRERTCFLHPFSAEKEEVGWGGFYPLHWRREWFCREGRRGRLHPPTLVTPPFFMSFAYRTF